MTPTSTTMRRMSQALDVPLDFLALPTVMTPHASFRDIRRTATADRRRALAIAHLAHDLVERLHSYPSGQLGVFAPTETRTRSDDERLETVASELRGAFGLPTGPVGNVIATLENSGIVVIRDGSDTARTGHFSVPFHRHPVIALSPLVSAEQTRLEAAHELGHLVLHGRHATDTKADEKAAEQFAAAFLMPEADFRSEFPSAFDWRQLHQLAGYWQVPAASVVRRALVLGCVSERTALRARRDLAIHRPGRRLSRHSGGAEEPRLLEALLTVHLNADLVRVMPPVALRAFKPTISSTRTANAPTSEVA
jgi:Zn-dependent peptidase ImmA (M78 family)